MKNILSKTLLIISILIFGILLSSFIYRISNINNNIGILDSKDKEVGYTESIQINILNSSGKSGLASKARNYLRKLGFDVVEIGNHNKILEKSIVIDRIGDINSSLKTASALGIPDSCVYENIDSTLFLRATIILGKDYDKLKIY